MKGNISKLLNLYLTLQLITYMIIYKLNIPVIAQIFIGEFKKLVEFHALKPDTIARYIDKDFDLRGFFTDAYTNIVSMDQSASPLTDLLLYLVAAMFFVLLMVFLYMMAMTLKGWAKKKYENIKKAMFFNGIIRSISV